MEERYKKIAEDVRKAIRILKRSDDYQATGEGRPVYPGAAQEFLDKLIYAVENPESLSREEKIDLLIMRDREWKNAIRMIDPYEKDDIIIRIESPSAFLDELKHDQR